MYAGIVELLYGFDDVDDGAARADADVAGFRIEMFLHCQLSGSTFGGLNGGKLGCGGGGHSGEGEARDGLWEVLLVWEKVVSM